MAINSVIPIPKPSMKTYSSLALVFCSTLFYVAVPIGASEVDDILKSINGESKKTSSPENSSSGQNTALKKSSSTSVDSPSVESPGASLPKKKKVATQSSSRQVESQRPSITVWNPRDKLPKEITGQGVAGNFVIYGTSSEGNLILIPAEDAQNPFARQYWVVNRTYAGGSPDVLVPMGQREMVQVSPSQPLIFIGRGILPGVYNVQAQ